MSYGGIHYKFGLRRRIILARQKPRFAQDSCLRSCRARHKDSDVNLSPQGTRAIPLILNPVLDKESCGRF